MQPSIVQGAQTGQSDKSGFTLIEPLVVIAIIAILAVVVVLTLNPAQLLAQSRDANRVSDMATLTSALNLYTTDQSGASTFSLGIASDTYPSVYDPAASSTCGSLGLPSLSTSTGQSWYCSTSSTFRQTNSNGWIPVNLGNISAGSPIGNLPVDPVDQTSTGLYYTYNTNGSQFEVTADLESQKYKEQYGNSPNTSMFPEVVSGGTPTVSALYNPAGLVGYWPMNEGSGSSTIDQSGNGNNGTWSGTASCSNTYYSSGKTANFSGCFVRSRNNSAIIGNPSILQLTSSMTLTGWIYVLSASNYATILQNGTTTTTTVNMYTGSGGVGIRFYLNNGAMGVATTTPLNTWYQFAATWDGATMKLYINGQFAASNAYSVPLSYANGWPWFIGESFSGNMNDVRIYNRALSSAEVMALYNAER